jgi:hypothetical protein
MTDLLEKSNEPIPDEDVQEYVDTAQKAVSFLGRIAQLVSAIFALFGRR